MCLYAREKKEKNFGINLDEGGAKKIEFLKRKRKAKNFEFYSEKDLNEKNNIENDFMEEEELEGDLGSDLDKSGISSSSELNEELFFGKNYLGEKVYTAIEESQLAVDKKLSSEDIAKITGMIIAIPDNEIVETVQNSTLFNNRIKEALRLLNK